MHHRLSVDIDTEEIGDIPHIRLIIKRIMMRALHRYEQLTDGLGCQLAGLALGEGQHGALHEVELLLEIIKADTGIDLVPVEHLGLVGQLGVGAVIDALKAAVDVLVVENIEQLLEQEPIAEVHSKVLDLPASAHGENLVQKHTEVVRLLQNRAPPVLITLLLLHRQLLLISGANIHNSLVTIPLLRDHLLMLLVHVLLAFLLIYLLILLLLLPELLFFILVLLLVITVHHAAVAFEVIILGLLAVVVAINHL